MIAVAMNSYDGVLLLFILFVGFVAYRLRQPSRLPDDIPWVGGSTTLFGKLLAPYRAVLRPREFLEEAYYKFDKLGRVCVMPSILEKNRIFLPSSYMDWVVHQPEQKLSARAIAEIFQTNYTLQCKAEKFKPEFVHHQIKRHLDEVIPDLMDEIGVSMDKVLGLDTKQYKTVNLNRTSRSIVVQTINRFLVGQPLCRDASYIKNVTRYVESVPLVGFLIRLLPSRLRPSIGRTFTLINRFFYLKCTRSVSPKILERMTRWQANAGVTHNNPPNDWISWAVEDAMKRETHKTVDQMVCSITEILTAVIFAGTHSTTLTTSQFVLNVFSAPVEQHCLSDLLTECESLNKDFGSKWNRARMTKMVTMDSALRESMRLSSLNTTIQTRKVMAPNGLILPNDIRLPCGSIVDMAAYSVHHDESIYPEPSKYRHTRFMQSSEDRRSHQSASTTEPTFLGWGYGKHACPGRFLVVDNMKLIMTYLITNYEVKPLSETPKSKWFMGLLIPPLDATIEVRRRAGTVEKEFM